MTFLNPLYLMALTAAAIPIILHLLNLRKSRVIEFSTLTFLKELQRSKIRKLKIRQWILLALRTLIVIFIVLAFTRPALRSSFGFLPGTQAKSSVVLIIDDSFSMFASDDEGPFIKQAKERANAILDVLKPGDEVALIRMSEARKENCQFTAAINAIRDEVETLQPSFKHCDLTESLTAASVLLDRSNNFNKEVYLISDDHRSHYRMAIPSSIRPLFAHAVKMFSITVGKKKPENSAVTDVRIENALFEKNKPVDITASILNDAGEAITNGIVSVFLNGERVVQKSIDVEAGAKKDIAFTVVPKESGFVEGFVELEDDAIPEDNRRYFAFFVPENLRVLLAPSGTQAATIIRLALQPAVGADSVVSTYQIDALDKNSILSANPAKYDVVVLLGASSLSPALSQRFITFVKDGGSILLMPDADGTEIPFATLLPKLGLPVPVGVSGSLLSKSSYTSFEKIDFDHPLFRNVFSSSDPNAKPEVESPRLYFSIRLRGNESAQQVVSTTGGDAFLLDHRFGKGRVLVFAVSPSLQWSDLPFKGIFVPLMNRAMFYLAAREDNIHTDIIGNQFDVAIPQASGGLGIYDIVSPSDKSTRIVPKSMPSGLYFTMSDLDQPGVYDLKSAETTLRKIPVNIDPVESDMTRVTSEERDEFFKRLGIASLEILDRNVNVKQAVTQARFGVELWKYMIALALLCAILEMYIARDGKRAHKAMVVE